MEFILNMPSAAMLFSGVKCLAAGMDDYISKPIGRQKLEDCIKKHI